MAVGRTLRWRESRWIRSFFEAGKALFADKGFRLAAAVAFFSIFSLAPLVLIVLSLAGWILGQAEARVEMERELGALLSPRAAETMLDLSENVRKSGDSVFATVAGIAALVFGATGVFGQLQDALNSMWGVEARPKRGWLHMLRKRLLSFGMVLVIGFLLLTSLALSALLNQFTASVSDLLQLPGELLQSAQMAVSFLIATLLFASIFVVLPDARIRLRDVWVGASVTAVLFTLGKIFLAWYLGREGTTSAYGAAGAFVLVLLWIYFSALILFFGAEFTQAHARNKGAEIQPAAHAVRVEKRELPTEGSGK